MTDSQVAKARRKLKPLEPEMVRLYLEGRSLSQVASIFTTDSARVSRALARHGVQPRTKSEGCKLRSADPEYRAKLKERDRTGEYQTGMLSRAYKHGLSADREFRTTKQREYRRDKPAAYHEIDARRKAHLSRMPKWANPKKIRQFYEMARDLGLSVDHIIPLQGENVCGLHVENNLQLMSQLRNCQKSNSFTWGPDPLIGKPKGSHEGSEVERSAVQQQL